MNVIFSLWSHYELSRLSPGDQSAGTRETEEIQAGGQRPAGRKGLCLARAQFPEPLSHTQRRTMDAYPSALLRGTYRGPCNKRDRGEDGVLHRGPQGHRHVPQVLPRKGDGRQNGRKAHEEPEGRPGWSPQASGCCGVSPPWATAPGAAGDASRV